MGTKIDGVAWTAGGLRAQHSALRLADLATRHALADAERAATEIDLLVNCGLYRDRNLGEPALAALIQEDVGMNVEDPHDGGHGTFSFDLANGTCGPLTALQIVDRFARVGTIHAGVIVASDANPGHHLAPEFEFAPVGGAFVCRWDDDGRGVGDVVWLSSSDGGASFRAQVGFDGTQNRLWTRRETDYEEKAGALAGKVAVQSITENGVAFADLEAVVLAPASTSLVDAFCDASGCDPRIVITAGDASIHTASFIVAFETARRERRILPGSDVLFVSAGAGVVAGACLYRA